MRKRNVKEHRALPADIVELICWASDQQGLWSLQHVSTVWRYFSLPLLWRDIEIGEWECKSSAFEVQTIYGRYIQSLTYRQHNRRRGTSHSLSLQPCSKKPDSKTKTEILCEWFSISWESVQQVTVGAWPPYNITRVQLAVASTCPHLRVLTLEGAAAAWASIMRQAVAANPYLHGFHVSEDQRASLPSAPDGLSKEQSIHFDFLLDGRSQLTHITIPCLADSVCQFLSQLPRILPALHSLDLRQVDAGISRNIHINLPPILRELKISGQHPLNIRMFGSQDCRLSQPSLMAAAQMLNTLAVQGSRSEEAAQCEIDQFWSIIFKQKWPVLTKLVVPVAHSELGPLILSKCASLQYLHIAQAGSSIHQEQNMQWATCLTQLNNIRYLNIASSNNEYEGCCIPKQLVTTVSWRSRLLGTLYLSRLCLSTDDLHLLLCMLPCLHTLWFTFNAADDSQLTNCKCIDGATHSNYCLRYLIVQEIKTTSREQPPAFTSNSSIKFSTQATPSSISTSAKALSACLQRLPVLNRCRLPMFTFPDSERYWLQRRFPRVEFKKYAPPY